MDVDFSARKLKRKRRRGRTRLVLIIGGCNFWLHPLALQISLWPEYLNLMKDSSRRLKNNKGVEKTDLEIRCLNRPYLFILAKDCYLELFIIHDCSKLIQRLGIVCLNFLKSIFQFESLKSVCTSSHISIYNRFGKCCIRVKSNL